MASWEQRLSRPILLKETGRKLVTLRDAGDFLAARFGSVRHSVTLAPALEDLMAAAQSGEAGDREAATEQVEAVLVQAGLIDPPRGGGSVFERLRRLIAREKQRAAPSPKAKLGRAAPGKAKRPRR